jgi:hypothetical protein
MWQKRANKVFYLIDPMSIKEAMKEGTKSIDETGAHEMAFEVGYLRK